MRTNYPRHLAAFSYVGVHQYSLTFCTFGRRRAFESAENVADACAQVLRAAREHHFDVIAYCFMPDHLHLVVVGTAAEADLKAFIRRAKQYTGYYFSQRTGTRLWQRYGYEHVIRDDERLQEIVRYVLENPVRAGLAQSVQDYPYVGSSIYTVRELLAYAAG